MKLHDKCWEMTAKLFTSSCLISLSLCSTCRVSSSKSAYCCDWMPWLHQWTHQMIQRAYHTKDLHCDNIHTTCTLTYRGITDGHHLSHSRADYYHQGLDSEHGLTSHGTNIHTRHAFTSLFLFQLTCFLSEAVLARVNSSCSISAVDWVTGQNKQYLSATLDN